MRVLVLGGTGNFGARICRALAADTDMQIIAAGRGRRAKMEDARIASAQLDMAAPDFAAALKRLAPQLVIHCAGPFQGQDYRVAEAALAAGAHYIDLADGRDFVARFAARNDAAARAAGLPAVTGASTLPALSAAVIDRYAAGFQTLGEIQIVIAPGQRAPRGAATIAGVFSYAGRPIPRMKDGVWSPVYGWQSLRRVDVKGVGRRWAAACDVPDHALLPARYPGVRTVEFRAALEIGAQHAALWLAAGLRRCGLPLPIERWAAPLDRIASLLDRFGGERGGMTVTLAGAKADGRRARLAWHLVADGNHGPEIPCMPAILLARKLAKNDLPMRGAMPCMGLLTLDEFAPEFARWGIATGIGEEAA